MSDMMFYKNLDSLNDDQQKLKEYLFHNRNIKKEDNFQAGVEEVCERKVLYTICRNNTYQLDSLYDSERYTKIWFEELENVNYRSRYLLFGFGNGMYVKELLKHIDEEAFIIVVEPSIKIFAEVIEEFDIAYLLSNKQVLLIVEGFGEIRFRDALFEHLTYEDMSGMVIRSYINYQEMFTKQYLEFEQTIQFCVDQLNANEYLYERLGKHYFYNIISNYPLFLKGKSLINLNKKIPKNIPAILVAAGPSLDKNMQTLKKAKNRSFILAVDAAVRALVKKNIIPDMIISIDAQKMYLHLDSAESRNIPLLAYLHSNRMLMEIHKGDKYFMHGANPYMEEIFNKINKSFPDINSGGSVATAGFEILGNLQFETIILVGQDLAYTDGKTHTSDAIRSQEQCLLENEEAVYLEDIHGKSILSSKEFYIYLDWFKEKIRANPKIRVIDATEGGAKIEGTIIMPLQEAVAKECIVNVDMDTIMKSIVTRLTYEEQALITEHMHMLPKRIKNIYNKAEKAALKCQEILENLNNIELTREKMTELSGMLEDIENDSAFYFVNCLLKEGLYKEQKLDVYKSTGSNSEDLVDFMTQTVFYLHSIMRFSDNAFTLSDSLIKVVESDELRRKEILPKEALEM